MTNSPSENEVYTKSGEELYLSSDWNIFLYSNCNNIDQRKGIIFSNSAFRPLTNNDISLGTEHNRWHNIYSNNLTLQNSTVPNLSYNDSDNNANITFKNINGNQGVSIIFNDYNNYKDPYGLTIIGNGQSTNNGGAYLKVEGDIESGHFIRAAEEVQINRKDVDAKLADNGITTTIFPTSFHIRDKNGLTLNRLECVVHPTGEISSYWYIRNYNSDGVKVGQKGISMAMDKTGALSYSVADPEKFRTAINVISKSGDTLNGNLLISSDHAYNYPEGHYCGYAAKRTDTGIGIWMGVGNGGLNHGIYSSKTGGWMLVGDGEGNVTLNGNATTATKLKTARTISLTGAVTGSASFDGSKNISIATTQSTVLYNNVSGTNGTITLSQSAQNFKRIRVYYTHGTDRNNSGWCMAEGLMGTDYTNSILLNAFDISDGSAGGSLNNFTAVCKQIYCNGTTLSTTNYYKGAFVYLLEDANFGASDRIYIYKVEGFMS